VQLVLEPPENPPNRPGRVRIPGRGLFALRLKAAIIAIIFWNLLFLLARRLNGQAVTFQDPGALAVVAFACLAAATASFSVVLSKKVRRRALREKAAHLYEPGGFVFIAVVCLTIGVFALVKLAHLQLQ